MNDPLPAVFVGLDVGKSDHHAVALTAAGKTVLDKALPNDEAKLRAILEGLAMRGLVLMVVDQPATIGALPVAVAQAMDGVAVAYLPGLAMRRIADLHPGSAKTDARDAFIIAEAARTMPHTLRSIRADEEQIAALALLAGFDDDLAGEVTAVSNRLRGLLTQIHPALERALGPRIAHPAVTDLLTRYPTPARLASAGRGHVRARLKKHAPRLAERLTEEVFAALGEQTVTVPGTDAAGVVIPILAEQLATLTRRRDEVAAQVEALVEAHPLHKVLTSLPGVGVRTAARILTEVVGKDFKDAAHLASYAGIAPVTRRSGTSIRGEHAPRGGNKRLKRALFLSAFASLEPPALTDLLRPQTRSGQTAQPSRHRPRPPPLRRALRHAPRRHPLPASDSLSGLTKTIEAPPCSALGTSWPPSGRVTGAASARFRRRRPWRTRPCTGCQPERPPRVPVGATLASPAPGRNSMAEEAEFFIVPEEEAAQMRATERRPSLPWPSVELPDPLPG